MKATAFSREYSIQDVHHRAVAAACAARRVVDAIVYYPASDAAETLIGELTYALPSVGIVPKQSNRAIRRNSGAVLPRCYPIRYLTSRPETILRILVLFQVVGFYQK